MDEPDEPVGSVVGQDYGIRDMIKVNVIFFINCGLKKYIFIGDLSETHRKPIGVDTDLLTDMPQLRPIGDRNA